MILTRILTRRHTLMLGGGLLVTLAAPRNLAAADAAVIEMSGTARGERVWFTPIGIAIDPGATLRFENRDRVNSHTSTSYHPDLFDRPLRIPQGAEPWDSGFLMPGEHFDLTLIKPGVYDYYCQPHEHAGMVGRIVVGTPDDADWQPESSETGDIPEVALTAFPAVDAILENDRINAEGHG